MIYGILNIVFIVLAAIIVIKTWILIFELCQGEQKKLWTGLMAILISACIVVASRLFLCVVYIPIEMLFSRPVKETPLSYKIVSLENGITSCSNYVYSSQNFVIGYRFQNREKYYVYVYIEPESGKKIVITEKASRCKMINICESNNSPRVEWIRYTYSPPKFIGPSFIKEYDDGQLSFFVPSNLIIRGI